MFSAPRMGVLDSVSKANQIFRKGDFDQSEIEWNTSILRQEQLPAYGVGKMWHKHS